MTMVPNDALVVVADGGSARVFRNRGDERALSLHQVELRELMNMDDDGPAGSMPHESTGAQIDEATFAKQLAQWINQRALGEQLEGLVLMADPQTLGQIRRSLHKTVNDRLIGEIDKNMSNAPLEDIVRALG